MDDNKIKDLFHELIVLWSLHIMGGKAEEDELFAMFNELSKTVINNKWNLTDVIDGMLRDGYSEDRLGEFLIKAGTIPAAPKSETVH